jgi:phosphonoacetate hydrolase
MDLPDVKITRGFSTPIPRRRQCCSTGRLAGNACPSPHTQSNQDPTASVYRPVRWLWYGLLRSLDDAHFETVGQEGLLQTHPVRDALRYKHELAGVCCGVHADEHGITGNSYWDADSDQERFMSDGNLLTDATIFQRAGRYGVRSVLVSAKQKSVSLLRQGIGLAIGSQEPPPEIVDKHGKPPDIYSMDVNYWVWKVAVDLIKTRPKVGLFFVHTTDYPMHKFPPESGESRVHLKTIDEYLAQAADADPDMAFFIVPDHGLNAKTTVLNLNKTLARKEAEVKIVMSAERDQYPRHHSGFGGTSYIYLKSPDDADKVIKVLRDVQGIEEILFREEAARKYKLNPHRIGDLWLTAAKDVVFGPSTQEREKLPQDYRSHGSSFELDIPCFIYRYAGKLPDPSAIATNADVCKFLYRG